MDASMAGQLERVNDIDMYYETIGEGEPLVLLHGFTGCGADWATMIDAFAPGHRLIIPDLRGHGRSTNPSGDFTFRQVARDVFALLDGLGIDRFKAVGMSAGAKTLLHMATQQPGRIDAMVLVSATPWFPAEARAIMRMMTPENQPPSEWEIMRQRHVRGEEQILELWRIGNHFKDSYDDMSFTPPLLATIQAKTLIVHGDRDPLYPVELALQLRASIPRSWLWVVPNGGHGPIFGDLTPAFVETSVAFLRGMWDSH